MSGITATRAHSGKPPEKSVSGPNPCVAMLHPVYCNILGHIVVLCSSKTYYLIGDFSHKPSAIHTLSLSSLPVLLRPAQPPLGSHFSNPAPQQASLGLEVFWADLHLHPFEGVGRAMPTIPGDAIQMLVVLPKAVEDSIEVGICAAVVPVSTWHKKQISRLWAGCIFSSPRKWLIGSATGIVF